MKEEGKPSILFATKARRAGAKGKEEYHCSIASFLSFFWDVWDPLLGLTISHVAFFAPRVRCFGEREVFVFSPNFIGGNGRKFGNCGGAGGSECRRELPEYLWGYGPAFKPFASTFKL